MVSLEDRVFALETKLATLQDVINQMLNETKMDQLIADQKKALQMIQEVYDISKLEGIQAQFQADQRSEDTSSPQPI